jgi:hypothetical protein
MMSVTRRTLSTTSRHGHAGLLDQGAAFAHLVHRIADQGLDFLGGAGRALRQVAHFGRHDGKPRPCSPARAASTAAFRARILVWKAMPSITPMMSTIFLTRRRDRAHGVDHLRHHRAAARGHFRGLGRQLRWPGGRCRRFAGRYRSVRASSSEVWPRELACCSVREDRSRLPLAISLDAAAIASVLLRTSATMR